MTYPRGKTRRSATADRAAIDEFTTHMYLRMRINADLAHWNTVTQVWKVTQLRAALKELEAAVLAGEQKEVADTAAEVANFAMMIADTARHPSRYEINDANGELTTTCECGATLHGTTRDFPMTCPECNETVGG